MGIMRTTLGAARAAVIGTAITVGSAAIPSEAQANQGQVVQAVEKQNKENPKSHSIGDYILGYGALTVMTGGLLAAWWYVTNTVHKAVSSFIDSKTEKLK
ncbi:MAG: hypothetical protein HY094_00725 [Candidatus Melainabacteria bacterium]|nr:hypothetical protein [Candidatus Melainabacteria bacterium]